MPKKLNKNKSRIITGSEAIREGLIEAAKKYHKCNQTDPDPKGLLLYVINESKKYL